MSPRLFRRRRKSALALLALAIVGGWFVYDSLRDREATYVAGEQPEGLVDRLGQEGETSGPAVRFTEVAEEVGLEFVHFPGTRSNRLPEDMGGGVALGDFDGDGWVDVFLPNATGPMAGAEPPVEGARSRLFRNVRGRFVDVTDSCGIDLRAQALAAAFCDVDSDADLDLFVTTYGTCRLFENLGGGTFRDQSARAGLEAWSGFWSGVGVGDFDADGALDLYVCGYVDYVESEGADLRESSQYGVAIPALINPSNFEPLRNLFLVGAGDGTFEERAAETGADGPLGRSLGVLFCDLNDDGRPDLYVANDVSDNVLLLNDGNGRFVDVTAQALVGDYRGAMGLAAADYDEDQDLDLFITHWVAQENALYKLTSRNVDSATGLDVPLYFDDADRQRLGFQGLRMVGWATRFFDFDNDGGLDLFVVNGSTIPIAESPDKLRPMRTQLFWNSRGPDRFVEVGEAQGGFFSEPHVGRGGATFDFDQDGDEDLCVVLHGERARLLRNDGGNARPSVRLRLRQPTGNTFALGARVVAEIGQRRHLELVGTDGSYLSQHAVGELAFGLGEAGALEAFEVRWPDGEIERAGPFPAHSLVEWTRGEVPRVRPLPGRDTLDREGPESVSAQRHFYDQRKLARDARLAGDWERAVELYRQALVDWPGHEDCLYYLGNSLLALGQERAALGAFERLVHFQPKSNAGWMQIGAIRLPGGDAALDDLERSREAFEQCRDLNKEESRPVLQLGIVACVAGDLELAREHFEHVMRQNPRSVEARWFAGLVEFRDGDRERARELLDEARSLLGVNAAGESASNEGDTKAGAAMTAEFGVSLAPELERWRSIATRSGELDAEYGAAGE